MNDRAPAGHSPGVVPDVALPNPVAETGGGVGREFDELYRAHHGFVWRVLKRQGVALEALDDATQEVFLVAYRRQADLQEGVSHRSWLFGICRRVASTVRRGEFRRRRRIAAVPEPEPTPQPAEELARQEAAEFVERFLATVRPKYRAVFVLADIEGMSSPEIAAALDINANTVRSRLHTVRKQFEEVVQTTLIEGGSPCTN